MNICVINEALELLGETKIDHCQFNPVTKEMCIKKGEIVVKSELSEDKDDRIGQIKVLIEGLS